MSKLKIDLFVEVLNRALSSKVALLLAFIGPLVVIPMPETIQRVENVISSNWIQLWALFVLGVMSSRHHEAIKKIHTHLGISS
jgi:hypothetical protein